MHVDAPDVAIVDDDSLRAVAITSEKPAAIARP
jgi:hypothetical protein